MLRMRRKIQNAKFMIQNIGSKLFIFHYSFFIPAKQAALPFLCLISPNTNDFKSREDLFEFLDRNSLIIAEGEEIRTELTNRSEDILLITEDHVRLRECGSHLFKSFTFRMDRIVSLASEYAMISGDHDRHLGCIFRCF